MSSTIGVAPIASRSAAWPGSRITPRPVWPRSERSANSLRPTFPCPPTTRTSMARPYSPRPHRLETQATPPKEEKMILSAVKVADFDQFLKVFSTKGLEKRKQHGSKGSRVFRDPEDP